MLNSFSGRELVVLDKSITPSGNIIVANIDPLVFSSIRLKGNLWTGAAGSGYSYSTIKHSELWLEDTATGEKVLETTCGGRPFNKTISLDGLVNPVNLKGHFNCYYGTNSCGQSSVDQVLCTIR